MAKVLITAGGTIESIDSVRFIHNSASGKLASIVADQVIAMNYDVTYVHAKGSILPSLSCNCIEIMGVRDLERVIVDLLDQNSYDLIIHSMAVSDFYVESIMQNNRSLEIGKGKISSNAAVDIRLVPAVKVIQLFKKYSDACLFGFKLLSNASDEDLLDAAHRQIESAQSDFVIANHKEKVGHDHHEAFLISKDGILERYRTKAEIADGIIRTYLRKKDV